MKKRALMGALAVMMLVFAAACDKNTEFEGEKSVNVIEQPENTAEKNEGTTEKPDGTTEKPDGTTENLSRVDGYEETLAKVYNFIVNAGNKVGPDEGFEGIWEAAVYMDDAINKIGYASKDLNGDGSPELLIGSFDKSKDAFTANEIYALYTLKDGSPELLLEGFGRSMYSLKDDNSLFYQGSDGAAYSIFGVYHIDDGGNVVCDDYYFTSPAESNPEAIEIYHNRSGVFYTEETERLSIDLDEFYILEKEASKGTAKLFATPFAELDEKIIAKASEKTPAVDASLLFGEWTFVSGETDGWTFTAQEAGIESEISIIGTDTDLIAKILSKTEFDTTTLEAKLMLTDEPLYKGCGNDEWSVRLAVTKGDYSDEDEFYATLVDESTLLLKYLFPFDGTQGVSYQTYKRK